MKCDTIPHDNGRTSLYQPVCDSIPLTDCPLDHFCIKFTLLDALPMKKQTNTTSKMLSFHIIFIIDIASNNTDSICLLLHGGYICFCDFNSLICVCSWFTLKKTNGKQLKSNNLSGLLSKLVNYNSRCSTSQVCHVYVSPILRNVKKHIINYEISLKKRNADANLYIDFDVISWWTSANRVSII